MRMLGILCCCVCERFIKIWRFLVAICVNLFRLISSRFVCGVLLYLCLLSERTLFATFEWDWDFGWLITGFNSIFVTKFPQSAVEAYELYLSPERFYTSDNFRLGPQHLAQPPVVTVHPCNVLFCFHLLFMIIITALILSICLLSRFPH